MTAIADPEAGYRKAEKHKIHAAAFGGHLFYNLFSQAGGCTVLSPPPWISYWTVALHSRILIKSCTKRTYVLHIFYKKFLYINLAISAKLQIGLGIHGI